MAVGSISGALATGARGRISERLLVGAAIGFGASSLAAAVAPTLPLEMLALAPLGFASVTFAAGVNSTLQLGATPAMRGRVMALYSVVFLGSTPIGGPIVGWLAETAGPRSGLILGGVAAIAAGVGGWIAFSRTRDPDWRLSGLGGRWSGRLRDRWAVAIQAGGADELQRLEGGRGLNVEANSVALLDRLDGSLAPAPHERDRHRVAGADDRDLSPEEAGDADRKRERTDRPKAHECDPPRALGRQAGRHPRTGEHATHRARRLRRPTEPRPGERGNHPPNPGHFKRELVDVAVGDDDADGRQRRGNAGDEENGNAQKVVELHQRSRNRSASSAGDPTTTSASR
jgi:hypothetical protein